MASPLNDGSRVLAFPQRNHFFYGKLMDVAQWRKDQRHFDQKRSLVNRLLHGHGVACGLGVVAGEEGRVRLLPGVALDGWGREIVVPEAVAFDAHQPTDDQGQPMGDPLEGGLVELRLAYAERPLEPVPVLVADCDTPGQCAPATIREEFRILVRPAGDALPDAPSCGSGSLEWDDPAALHRQLVERLAAGCPDAPDDPCVVLGRVNLDDDTIDIAAGRRLAYGAALLHELVLCLADRVLP
jgi:hypothetical protein